jgi:CheY-like chemotaxis protein
MGGGKFAAKPAQTLKRYKNQWSSEMESIAKAAGVHGVASRNLSSLIQAIEKALNSSANGQSAVGNGAIQPALPQSEDVQKLVWTTHLEKRASLRIIVADDHESVRKGVCVILGTRGDIEVCGEASNGQEAIDKALELRPDLIILDVTMPVVSGIDAAEVIRRTMPQVPILFLSMHQGRQIIAAAKRIGVKGYVRKSDAAATLLNAVDALLRDEPFFPEGI